MKPDNYGSDRIRNSSSYARVQTQSTLNWHRPELKPTLRVEGAEASTATTASSSAPTLDHNYVARSNPSGVERGGAGSRGSFLCSDLFRKQISQPTAGAPARKVVR